MKQRKAAVSSVPVQKYPQTGNPPPGIPYFPRNVLLPLNTALPLPPGPPRRMFLRSPENAMHPYELPEVHYTVVRVAKDQMGIGGDDSWGARTHEEYLLKTDKKMEFSFVFKGL